MQEIPWHGGGDNYDLLVVHTITRDYSITLKRMAFLAHKYVQKPCFHTHHRWLENTPPPTLLTFRRKLRVEVFQHRLKRQVQRGEICPHRRKAMHVRWQKQIKLGFITCRQATLERVDKHQHEELDPLTSWLFLRLPFTQPDPNSHGSRNESFSLPCRAHTNSPSKE